MNSVQNRSPELKVVTLKLKLKLWNSLSFCRSSEMSDIGGVATQPLSPVAASSFAPTPPAADSIWGWLVPSVASLPPLPLKCSSYKVGRGCVLVLLLSRCNRHSFLNLFLISGGKKWSWGWPGLGKNTKGCSLESLQGSLYIDSEQESRHSVPGRQIHERHLGWRAEGWQGWSLLLAALPGNFCQLVKLS